MKKTLIALALVSVSAAASADVVLYGNIRGGVEVNRNFTSKDTLAKLNVGTERGTSTKIADYGSYIGFKGHEDLNNSLRAIWQVEQKVSIGGHNDRTWATRDSFIGLAGNFGTVKAGYLSTPTKDANGRLDEWEYDDNAAGLGVFTRDNDAVKRAGAVSYTTPNFGGLTASAYVSPSDNNNGNKVSFLNNNKEGEQAIYGARVGYENAGFFGDVAGTYVKNSNSSGNTKDGYQAVANVGYDANNWLAGVAYQQGRYVDTLGSLTGEGKDLDDTLKAASIDPGIKRSQEVASTVAYTLNNNLRLKGSAAYGFGIDSTNGMIDDAKYIQGIVGADYLLSKRTVLNGQVGYLEFRGKDDGVSEKVKKGTVGVGMKHKF